MQTQLKFFNIPKDVRQRIYNINTNDKLKKIETKTHYFKEMIINELKNINREMKHFRDTQDLEMDIVSYIGFINDTRPDMSIRRLQHSYDLSNIKLDKWLCKLDNDVYSEIFRDINKMINEEAIKASNQDFSDSDTDSDSD